MEIILDAEPLDGRPPAESLAVLDDAGLISADLGEVVPTFTARAVGPPGLVGVAALEVIGSVGLVRSVAVVPDQRGQGVGAGLVEALVGLARDHGLASLFLLTEDAAEYFTHLGFTAIPRDEAPGPIRNTSQFSQLCPDTAVLMRRTLP